MKPVENHFVKVSFASPAVVLDFLSFLYRLAFIDEWEDCQWLMNGFYRVDLFSVAAHTSAWLKLFDRMQHLNPIYFNNRIGLLVFAVFMQVRKFDKSFEAIDKMPDFVSINDPVLIKKGLFEIAMDTITDVERAASPFAVDK